MEEYKDIIQMYNNIRTYAKQRDLEKILNRLENYSFDVLSFEQSPFFPFKDTIPMPNYKIFGESLLMNLILDTCGKMPELFSSFYISNLILKFKSFFNNNRSIQLLMVNVNPFYKKAFESILDNDSDSVELLRSFVSLKYNTTVEHVDTEYLLYAADYSGNVDVIKEIYRLCMAEIGDKSTKYMSALYCICKVTILELLLKNGLTKEFDDMYNRLCELLLDMYKGISNNPDCDFIRLYKIAERSRDENFINNLLRRLSKLFDRSLWLDWRLSDEDSEKQEKEIMDFLTNISFKTSDATSIFKAYMTEKKRKNDRNAEIIMKLLSDDAVFMLQSENLKNADADFYRDAGKWIKENNIPISIDNVPENDPAEGIYRTSNIKNIIKDNKLICNGNITENKYINDLFNSESGALPILINALDINEEMRDDLIDLCIKHKNFNVLNQVRHLM